MVGGGAGGGVDNKQEKPAKVEMGGGGGCPWRDDNILILSVVRMAQLFEYN